MALTDAITRSFVGTILLMTISPNTRSQKIGLCICYYITLSFWSAQTLALSMLSRNVAGQTKKSVAVAMNFIIWATGNAIGKLHILPHQPPRTSTHGTYQAPRYSSPGTAPATSLPLLPIWAATRSW